jgi:hypothetical protein
MLREEKKYRKGPNAVFGEAEELEFWEVVCDEFERLAVQLVLFQA